MALLRGIKSKINGNVYYVWIVFTPLEQKELESHKKVYENQVFCKVNMPSGESKILEFNQCQKSNLEPLIIYEDLE